MQMQLQYLKKGDTNEPSNYRPVSLTSIPLSNDYVTKCLADKNVVDVIYLDFLKAFDTISHTLLILKLKAYRIIVDLLDWIKNFLANRKQRLVSGEHISDWAYVTSDVPQG
ncbi:uncharacterized protein LOC136091127 [Hydra vulgaris]|uniref:Uncharacterized protein LOC136091127 n=1 Tax=Hydra vulgaris TaxID=6087 RepID=A0ABM4DI72_HYDVU